MFESSLEYLMWTHFLVQNKVHRTFDHNWKTILTYYPHHSALSTLTTPI
jgi:hypothetical protein